MYKRILSALTGFAMAFTMLGAVPSAAETDVSADINAENINGNEVSIEGTNALGDMLVQKINDAEESDDMGFTIQNVAVDGKNVTVEYSFIKSCTMVVGIFDDEGTVMLGKGVADIVTGSSSETVTIDIDTMPEHFLVKVFMVDSISYRPLGEAYTCELYTKKFQDFMALTTDDFDSESVLNLDEDKTNNFIVLKDGITRLDETDGEIVSSDDSDEQSPVTHTISGASDRVKALKAGDIFAAGDIENIVIAKVGSINVDGDTAVITEGDITGDEVFKVIKIDDDFSDADVAIDDSCAGEGVTFLGKNVDMPKVPEEYDGTGKLYDFSQAPEVETQEMNGPIYDYSMGDEFGFSINSEHDDFEGNPTHYDGSIEEGWHGHGKVEGYVGLTFNFSFKMFLNDDDDFEYVRISSQLELDARVTLNLKGWFQTKISKVLISHLGPLELSVEPLLFISGDATISFNTYITFVPTFEYNFLLDSEDALSNQTKAPEVGLEIKGVIDLQFGIKFIPKITLICDKLANIRTEITPSIHVVATQTETVFSANAKHTCSSCFSGKKYFMLDLSCKANIYNIDKDMKIELLNFKYFLNDFYYSGTYNEYGNSTCPHFLKRIEIILTDRLSKGKRLPNAVITIKDVKTGKTLYSNEKLDKDASIKLWFEKGTEISVVATLNDEVYKCESYEIRDQFETNGIEVLYDHSASKKNSSSSKPDDSSSSKPDSSSSKPDDTSSKPDSDSSAPENLKLTKTKETLDYKKGNGMKLLEGGAPQGCMGFIDDNDTLFIWGVLPIKKESDRIKMDYSYYSIPNIKKAKVQCNKLAFLTKDNDLYVWGDYGSNIYEKPTFLAKNVKDFYLDLDETAYAYIKTNGDLYVSGKFGSGDNSKTYDNTLMMKNVRSVSICSYSGVGACVTENNELYMWGSNSHKNIIIDLDDYGYYDITKIADDVKDVDVGVYSTYYITKEGDLHRRGVYSYIYKPSDEIILKGIKDVQTAHYYRDYELILAENGDLYQFGDTDLIENSLKKLYPEMKSYHINENKDLIITKKNGEEITIPAEERSDNFYKPTKIASSVKTMTNLYNNGMYIDNNNEIYIFGHNFGGGSSYPEYTGIYDRKGLLWDNIQLTPVKLDDIYAQMPTIESETQSENADTSAVAEDDFTGLMPDCIYNVYGFNEDYMDLSNEGLAYIDQFVTDSDGNLPFDKASVSGSEALFWKAVPMTRLSIANEKIEVKDLSYTGEEQFIEPTVTLDGKTLVLNYDYFIAQGDSATDAGEYTGIICGMGEYKGEAEFTYNVTGGGKLGDVNGDNAINVTDISLVAAHVKGRKALSANKFALADINKDGSVNVTDISRIAAHVKGVKSIK